ncbi:hypothetical protein DP117_14875 [Brasilonema sp. UFV-L1]|nr:hypothetical protein [Brasilonema sp. UFV-L1]
MAIAKEQETDGSVLPSVMNGTNQSNSLPFCPQFLLPSALFLQRRFRRLTQICAAKPRIGKTSEQGKSLRIMAI